MFFLLFFGNIIFFSTFAVLFFYLKTFLAIMKRILYVFAIAFVAVLSLGFVSCSNNDGPDAPPTAETSIVGTWKATIANEGVDPQVVYFRFIKEGTGDFIFANLVDFDMLYGHRNDMEGYAKALEYFDGRLPEIIKALKSGDMLIIAADHGCDPTTPGTDHSREYTPVIVTGPCIREGASLGTLGCFADIGATVFEYITGLKWPVGTSFLNIVC